VKELLEVLARALVVHKSDVVVVERTNEGVLELDVEVSPTDRGRVIGRRGRTAEALRTLMDAVGDRRGTPCSVEVVD